MAGTDGLGELGVEGLGVTGFDGVDGFGALGAEGLGET
jgi:hypothetical protein